jgi:hypothetical protein
MAGDPLVAGGRGPTRRAVPGAILGVPPGGASSPWRGLPAR